MADERNIAQSYSVGEVAAALNLSRTTLLYYEQRGIVHPSHDEGTGYRTYTNDDVMRLMNSVALKNVGVPPRDVAALLDDGPYTPERFDEYDALLRRRIERLEAIREQLVRRRELRERVGEVRDEQVEAYYISYDGSRDGFRGYPDDEGLDALLDNVPISSLAMQFGDDYFDVGARGRWGRAVPVRYAHLVDGLPDNLEVMGGCRCLTAVKHDDDMYDVRTEQNSMAGRFRARMGADGLRPAGRAFCPYTLCSEQDGVYIMVCLPVEEG